MPAKQTHLLDDVLIQQGASNCGPVSLLNVLRLKGDDTHNEEELAELCHAKPGFGTTDEKLLEAARAVGLEVTESKEGGTVADLEHHIDNGDYVIICYTNAFSGNGHYSVVVDYDEDALYLRDSSLGSLRLRKDWLAKWWHGASGSQQWYAAVR